MPIVPIIHRNGTSRSELWQLRIDAHVAVLAAYEKLQAMSPNERDYYIGEPGLFKRSVAQHDARLAAVKFIADDIMRELEALPPEE